MFHTVPASRRPPSAVHRAPWQARPRSGALLPIALLAVLLLLPAGSIGQGAKAAPNPAGVTTPAIAAHLSDGAALLAEARASLNMPAVPAANSSFTVGWKQLGGGSYVQPSARSAAALAYDPLIGAVVLFGGYDASVAADGDTWTFANNSWTDITLTLASAPPARWEAGFAYDPNVGAVVLFGGRNVTQFFNDTWEFNGAAWSQLSLSTQPSPRGLMGMAYDPVVDGILLFGGGTGNVPGRDLCRLGRGLGYLAVQARQLDQPDGRPDPLSARGLQPRNGVRQLHRTDGAARWDRQWEHHRLGVRCEGPGVDLQR